MKFIILTSFYQNVLILKNLLQSKRNLKFIATRLNLKSLKFYFKDDRILATLEATFESLTSLSIHCAISTVCKFESVYRFLQCCPMLHDLYLGFLIIRCFENVENYKEQMTLVIDKIIRSTNVQHLKFGANIECLKRIFDALQSDFGESRKLILTLEVCQWQYDSNKTVI